MLIFFYCALCGVSHIYSYIFCAILLYMFCCVLDSIAYRGIVPINSRKSLLALWRQNVDGEILSEFFYQKVGNFFIKK